MPCSDHKRDLRLREIELTQDAAKSGGCAQECDIPSESTGFASFVAIDCADDRRHLVIEEEKNRDYDTGNQSGKYPRDGQLPEFDKESFTI
jgi:hypothetical protein